MIDAAAGRRAFAERFPEIAETLERPGALSSTLIVENGVAVDAAINDTRLYGGNALRFTQNQVDAFMAKPLRLFMERPTAAGLVSPICVRLHDALAGFLLEETGGEISSHVLDSPNFLVVFGLGLGHHIAELARRAKPRWLIVAEPIVDFIGHSFHTVDWPALFEDFESRGGGVHFVTDLDPGKMVSGIVRFMSACGIPYVDGSHVFTHYPLWAFREGRNRLYEAVEFAFINRGFFEDELTMMTNAVTNFAAGPAWLLEGRPRLHRPELAVVAGAGPSLDEALPRLREIRDRVVLFSAGTALRPLLRQGFVPDFHCELENVPATVDALAEAAKAGNLKDITLIASATVDPRVPPLFRETIYFFRDTVSSTQILGESHLPITGATPTCVNMAVSMAAFLGFTDLALIGTDCGIKPGGEDHAQDTIYRDIEQFKTSGAETERFPIEVEGNFGGIARTDWIYDSCRLMLAEVIQRRRLNAFNASDGAFIPGSVPRVPESIEPLNGPIDRRALFDALKRTLDQAEPGGFFRETDLAAAGEGAKRLFADLGGLLDELGRGAPDFAAAYDAIMRFLTEAEAGYGHTDAILMGTLQALPRIAMFFGFRISNAAIRIRLYSLFISELKDTVKIMDKETTALFSRLVALAQAALGEQRQNRRGRVRLLNR